MPRTVDAPAWLPSAGEILDALHRHEESDTRTPPAFVRKPASASWSIHVPAEEWAKIPAWWSGAHWFDTLLDSLATPERETARRRWPCADRTLLAIAHVLRYAAEPSTGRHVTVSYATIRARVLANSQHADGRTIRLSADETVRLAIRTLEHLGFVHVHATGRNMLSREEKAEAFNTHGRRQEAAANVLALTLPHRPAVENSCDRDPILGLTASPSVKASSTVKTTSQSPREMEPATRAQPGIKKLVREDASAYVPEVGRSLDRQMLLARLDAHYAGALAGPRLGKGGRLLKRHIGQIEHLLTRLGVDLNVWKWWQITARIDNTFPDATRKIIDADDPLRYFGGLIKLCIPPGDKPTAIITSTPFDPALPAAAAQAPATPPKPAETGADQLNQTIDKSNRLIAAELLEKQSRDRAQRRQLTDALLGGGARASDFPAAVRHLHDEVQTMHETLSRHNWTLDMVVLAEYGDIVWTLEPSSLVNTPVDDSNIVTSIRFAPPAHAGIHDNYILNQAGLPHADLCLTSASVRHMLTRLARDEF